MNVHEFRVYNVNGRTTITGPFRHVCEPAGSHIDLTLNDSRQITDYTTRVGAAKKIRDRYRSRGKLFPRGSSVVITRRRPTLRPPKYAIQVTPVCVNRYVQERSLSNTNVTGQYLLR